ncbi:MAG: cytochrome c peroxidase [Methylococcaceae bacterium]
MSISIGCLAISNSAQAHSKLTDNNLQTYKVPAVPNLLDGKSPIIVDKTAAIQLGKALFWDTNVGSNGVACATCHFHAGADRRTTNQVNTGTLHLNDVEGSAFDSAFSSNYVLKAANFPLFKFQNPDNINSNVLFKTDDVVGSAGTYKQDFNATSATESLDLCTPTEDAIHHVGNAQTRQTTARNAPTIINAAFYRRNFWDGRANYEFNGTSIFGPRDPDAKIWVTKNQKLVSQKISLPNASLASQALGPPADMIEMSCKNRTFKDIAKKLLPRKPLDTQEVHIDDSVLADIKNPSGLGLSSTYESLIKKSFNSIYWSSETPVAEKGKNYSQIEANFSFFFGLAIQMYENTLISDQSKLDLGIASMEEEVEIPPNFNELEIKGLEVFADAHCDLCHSAPIFSTAVNYQIYSGDADKGGNTFVDRIGFTPANSNDRVDYTLNDVGFFNTSVVPDEYDVGLGGKDPWGNPLSYAQQYLDFIGNPKKKPADNFTALSCNFTNPFTLDFKKAELVQDKAGTKKCYPGTKNYARVPKSALVKKEAATLDQGRLSTLTTGTFKVPTLRNVELTGPYMHNGSMKSLEEVVEFYNRGGNVHNRRHPDTLVFSQNFTTDDKKALVAFLKTLTDERVRWEKAPFDHPSIKVPNGHNQTVNGNLLDDNYLSIPAVGKNGLSSNPLKAFQDYLE